MRTVDYALEGKAVPATLRGSVIKIKVAESVQDGVASGVFKSEQALVEKANDGVVIAVQGGLRTKAGKDGMTVAKLQEWADAYCYDVRAEGSGVAREVKPETRVARAAAVSGNKMFERALTDETFLQRGIKNGYIDQAEFDTWKAAREEAAAAKATNVAQNKA